MKNKKKKYNYIYMTYQGKLYIRDPIDANVELANCYYNQKTKMVNCDFYKTKYNGLYAIFPVSSGKGEFQVNDVITEWKLVQGKKSKQVLELASTSAFEIIENGDVYKTRDESAFRATLKNNSVIELKYNKVYITNNRNKVIKYE